MDSGPLARLEFANGRIGCRVKTISGKKDVSYALVVIIFFLAIVSRELGCGRSGIACFNHFKLSPWDYLGLSWRNDLLNMCTFFAFFVT